MMITNKGGTTMYLDESGYFREVDIASPSDIKEADISWGLRVMYSGNPRQTGRQMHSRHVYRPKLSIFAQTPLIRLNLKKIV